MNQTSLKYPCQIALASFACALATLGCKEPLAEQPDSRIVSIVELRQMVLDADEVSVINYSTETKVALSQQEQLTLADLFSADNVIAVKDLRKRAFIGTIRLNTGDESVAEFDLAYNDVLRIDGEFLLFIHAPHSDPSLPIAALFPNGTSYE